MAERDYVLGAHQAELERLGLQHAVWRPRALDAWRRAGFTRGTHVLDIGAGPGYATFDLADVVGREGKVIALERAPNFLAHIRAAKEARGLAQVEVHDFDLAQTPELPKANAAWIRWVFAFLAEPEALLHRIGAALEPGSPLVIHEYADYATWRCFPGHDVLDRFNEIVKQSWRATGGEPDIAVPLARAMPRAGFRVRSMTPIVDVCTPGDFPSNWPLAFIETNTHRLAELGLITAAEAAAMRQAAENWTKEPTALMILPLVLEIIAEKV